MEQARLGWSYHWHRQNLWLGAVLEWELRVLLMGIQAAIPNSEHESWNGVLDWA